MIHIMFKLSIFVVGYFWLVIISRATINYKTKCILSQIFPTREKRKRFPKILRQDKYRNFIVQEKNVKHKNRNKNNN